MNGTLCGAAALCGGGDLGRARSAHYLRGHGDSHLDHHDRLKRGTLPGTLLLSLLHLAAAPDSTALGLAPFTAIDPDHADTVRAAIWYPSADSVRDTRLGLQTLRVARDGRLAGEDTRRPLVLLSHGTGGNEVGHWDTAKALVGAGFIVVTLRHPGDNRSDESGLGTVPPTRCTVPADWARSA